ncbi:glycosyltransferase 87 family protein [Gordonia sp. CPCC 205333]|uniref:glycosyltransferase 87 family protein n=1 Tax=Gordonia sp. CPCC 205333 TaxID=3140790 RepID=UPI003AF370DD
MTPSSTSFIVRHADWLLPALVFLAVRVIGLVVLARFAQLRGLNLGNTLAAWDGKWMLAIAEHGYAGVPVTQTDARGIHLTETAYAFFPGYPYLVRLLDKLPFVTAYGAAIAINIVLGCIAAAGAARLAAFCARTMSARSDDAASPDPARVGLILTVLFAAAPMGIVLSMAYTEALFCALAVWALIGVVEHRWLLAGCCAGLVGLTRPTAIVVVGVVMLAALLARRDGPRAWAAIALSPLGYLGYLGFVWAKTGSPTGWFRIQTDGWGTQFDWGAATYTFVNDSLLNSGEIAPVATSWIIAATIGLVVVAMWSRLPWPILVYGALVVASIILSSGLMMSRARLLLPAFVLLIPVAYAIARWRTSHAVAALLVIVIGSSWFGAHMLTVYPHAV